MADCRLIAAEDRLKGVGLPNAKYVESGLLGGRQMLPGTDVAPLEHGLESGQASKPKRHLHNFFPPGVRNRTCYPPTCVVPRHGAVLHSMPAACLD